MIPNRIVRYFFYLGYALGQYERTPFALFQSSLTEFYLIHLQHEFWWKQPEQYPKIYGLN